MILSDRQSGSTCIIDVVGEIIGTTARNQHLNTYIQKLVEKSNFEAIALNLEEVEAVDSYGLGVIIQIFKFAKENNLGFVIFHVNKEVLATFDLTGINELSLIFDSEEEALASLSKTS